MQTLLEISIELLVFTEIGLIFYCIEQFGNYDLIYPPR